MTINAWSHAATGLSLAITGLFIGKALMPAFNRPSFYRGPAGELLLGVMGLALTLMMFFFGFRIFFDNGLWGLLQLPLAVFVSGFLARIGALNNGLTPLVFAILGVALAVNIF